MKKTLIVLVVVAIIGVVVYTQRATIAMRILGRGVEAAMTTDATASLEDGLHVALCGAGGPMPDPKRSGACVAVVAGTQLFVVDAGTNGVRNLVRMRYPIGSIEALLLTHFHSDHIDGLGELATLRWVQGGNTMRLMPRMRCTAPIITATPSRRRRGMAWRPGVMDCQPMASW
jgi:ribonuclease Z